MKITLFFQFVFFTLGICMAGAQIPTHAPTFIKKPPPTSGGKAPTHAPTYIIRGPTHGGGGGGGMNSGLRYCFRELKKYCSCALVLKGDRCVRKMALMHCRKGLPKGKKGQSKYYIKLEHKIKRWCRKISPNGKGNP